MNHLFQFALATMSHQHRTASQLFMRDVKEKWSPYILRKSMKSVLPRSSSGSSADILWILSKNLKKNIKRSHEYYNLIQIY